MASDAIQCEAKNDVDVQYFGLSWTSKMRRRRRRDYDRRINWTENVFSFRLYISINIYNLPTLVSGEWPQQMIAKGGVTGRKYAPA